MAEDPEFERKLEAMFSSAKPRRGFEDELWKRIQVRRPWHERFGLRFQPALRYTPALAALLVVALGVTWVAGNFHRFGSGSATSASAPALGSQKASAPAFGVLPRLAPGGERAVTAPQATNGSADSGQGSSFSGTLPRLPPALPVYRYDEPIAADRATTAATLRAQTGLAVTVTPSDPATGVEPQFQVSGPTQAGSQGGSAETATGFLASHNLTPPFTFQTAVAANGREVIYVRLFDGPAGPIRQVRSDGTGAGITVDLTEGRTTAKGPLDLPLASARYQLRSAAEALSAANIRPGSGIAALDKAELVYVLVVSGGHGYYEPELLLTGPGGTVLTPVVAQEWLGA